MSTEVALLLLRMASAALLLTLLTALFVALWRDYRAAITEVEATRRSYGRLVVIEELDGAAVRSTEAYPLLPLTTLGRASTNTIPIDDTFASNEHALIAMRSGQWWLTDRNSRNGTILNDMTVDQPVVITDGDVIAVGHKRFRLELEQ